MKKQLLLISQYLNSYFPEIIIVTIRIFIPLSIIFNFLRHSVYSSLILFKMTSTHFSRESKDPFKFYSLARYIITRQCVILGISKIVFHRITHCRTHIIMNCNAFYVLFFIYLFTFFNSTHRVKLNLYR